MTNSSIPTFILDTDHPWLSENRPWLESYPDVANVLSDKSSPLWTNPSPGREIPADLFSRINIDNNKPGESRLGWDNAIARLAELRSCAAALQDVEYLHVYIYVHESQVNNGLVDGEMPSELPGMFADVLASMPHLERLDWGLDIEHTVAFGEEFARRNLILPNVRHLVPGAGSHYLISMCPALEILEAGSFFHHASWSKPISVDQYSRCNLVRAASAASNLKEFTLLGGWSTRMLEEVLKAMPNLVKLSIEGALYSIESPYEFEDLTRETWEEGELLKAHYDICSMIKEPFILTKTQRYLSIISKFPKLEQLCLPESSELELGFKGGSRCGNSYRGPKGKEYGRSVTRRSIEITELAGDMVTKAIPNLKILSIGDCQATLIHNDNGDVEVVWPWTGKVEDFVSEAFPQ
ncbi:hypothetical protein K445DRAFT_19062 [Daldinia sp. EC12]|nr:hypothetical protein K445DRAFT_19062 [Daldinia sp. EC12]